MFQPLFHECPVGSWSSILRADIPLHFCPHVFLGMGFVGRHLTTFLVESRLASHIRVVDKAPPTTGWLNDKHKVSEVQDCSAAMFGEEWQCSVCHVTVYRLVINALPA